MMASPIIVLTGESASASKIRRKPSVTHQSPQTPSLPTILSVSYKVTSRIEPTATPATTRVTRRTALSLIPSRPHYLLEPALPLYHPLGRLAKSLPDLDAEKYGLPVPARLRNAEISVDDDRRVTPNGNGNGKRPARSRKPAAKVRDGEADEDGQVKGDEGERISDESKFANVEIKEKPSPRKRRNGGGKRKRRDADDGDSAYPAKRARNPRHAQAIAPEDEVETVADDDKTVTERRTTRARANGTKRRDSSVSSEAPGLPAENSKASSEGEPETRTSGENEHEEDTASL